MGMTRWVFAVVVLAVGGVAVGQESQPVATTTSKPARAMIPMVDPRTLSPEVLPGKGLAEHDFIFTGEFDTRKPVATISLVKGGKVVWQYQMPTKDEVNGQLSEFSDMHMLSNGDVVMAYKTGWRKVNPAKDVIYDYKCPKNEGGGYNECHCAQPIDMDRVFFIENGVPHAVARIYNIKTGKVEMEHELASKEPVEQKSVHGQFRNSRRLPNGHYLIAHMSLGKVVEYDENWKELNSIPAPSVWDAVRLKNGNTLVSGNGKPYAREIAPDGTTVWEFNAADAEAQGYKIFGTHQVTRLENGNTVLTSWISGSKVNKANWADSVQLIEVTPEKKIVWAMREWGANGGVDMGTSSEVQFLDQGWVEENMVTH
jgi:hypothetical protein